MWLEYERSGCLHETHKDLLDEWLVTIPQMSTREGRWEVGSVQKYETPQGRIFWRSLDHYRTIFRKGYRTREDAAQELVKESPRTQRKIQWRKAQLAKLPLEALSVEAQRARLP